MKAGDGAGLDWGAVAAAVLCSRFAVSVVSFDRGGCAVDRYCGRAVEVREVEKFLVLLTARMAVLDCRAALMVASTRLISCILHNRIALPSCSGRIGILL